MRITKQQLRNIIRETLDDLEPVPQSDHRATERFIDQNIDKVDHMIDTCVANGSIDPEEADAHRDLFLNYGDVNHDLEDMYEKAKTSPELMKYYPPTDVPMKENMKITKTQLRRIIRVTMQQRGVSEDGAPFVGTGNFYVSIHDDEGKIYIEHGDGHPDSSVFEFDINAIDELIEGLQAIKGEL